MALDKRLPVPIWPAPDRYEPDWAGAGFLRSEKAYRWAKIRLHYSPNVLTMALRPVSASRSTWESPARPLGQRQWQEQKSFPLAGSQNDPKLRTSHLPPLEH